MQPKKKRTTLFVQLAMRAGKKVPALTGCTSLAFCPNRLTKYDISTTAVSSTCVPDCSVVRLATASTTQFTGHSAFE